MPILFSGNYKCDKCNENIEWNYFEVVRNCMSATSYVVDTKPEGLIYINEAKKMYNGKYKFSIICPYCRYINTFFYESTKKDD